MAAWFDSNTEQVIYSSGISQVMAQEYPVVYNLMQEELESTTAYLEVKAAMRSNPFRPPLLQSNGHEATQSIMRTVDEQLNDLPADAKKQIGKAIAEKCFNVASSLGLAPPGKSCMVASRVNGIDDQGTTTFIWSCGFDLSLSESESTSSRPVSRGHRHQTEMSSRSSFKVGYRLEGTLNIAVLCCRRQAIDNLESQAKRDYQGTKRLILEQYPTPPLFPIRQNSLPGRSMSATKDALSASHESTNNNKVLDSNSHNTDDRYALQSFMSTRSDWGVTILKIKESESNSLPNGAIDLFMHEIKYMIVQDLQVSSTFLFLNHVVVVYPQQNSADIASLMCAFVKPDGLFWSMPSRASQLKNSFEVVSKKMKSASFENVVLEIEKSVGGKMSN